MSVSDGSPSQGQSLTLSSLLGTTQGISTINNKLAPWQTIRDTMTELGGMNIQDLTHVLLTRDGSVVTVGAHQESSPTLVLEDIFGQEH